MQRKHFDILVSSVGLLLAVVLVVFAFYFKTQYDFAQTTVHDQLVAQKITFTPADKLSAEEKQSADLVAYAGQPLDDGAKAEVYANHYIALHLAEIDNGKTYSQLSAEARAKPDDTKLAGEVQTSFRGETLRGLLLTTYGFWQLGQQARFAMIICVVAALLLVLFAVAGYVHATRSRPDATV